MIVTEQDVTATQRMAAALGGWNKASRRLTRRMLRKGSDEQEWTLFCMLCPGTSPPFNPDDIRDAPSLVTHDPECFISIARIVLGEERP